MKINNLYYRSLSFFMKVSDEINLSRVYGAKYLAPKKIWAFPAIAPFHKWVIDDLETTLEGLTLDNSVIDFITLMDELESKAVSGDTRGFSSKFPPYEHQKRGLARIMYTPRCAIFWDPGLGKTKLICDRILYERQSNPNAKTLILALRVNLSTWVNEMTLHSDGKEKIISLAAPNPKKRTKLLQEAIDSNASGVVCTYETARVSVELLSKYKYDIIIADECHKMQSYKSKLTKAALALSKKAKYRYILSGTPTKGRPTDIWASLRFLGEFIVPKYWEFDKQYVSRAHYNRHIIIGYKNLGLLNDLLNEVGDSNKSEDCLDLPERTFQVVYITPTAAQRKVYNAIVRDKVGEVTISGHVIPTSNLLTKLGKLAQVASGFIYKSLRDPKICDTCPKMSNCVISGIEPYTTKCAVETKDPGNMTINITKDSPTVSSCVELCGSHLENGKKVIVWARHREMLDSLYIALSSNYGDAVLRYDSTIDNPGEVELSFNSDPNKKIIVSQITMGIGVTFKAPIMVYTELSFNLADWLQSLDRNWGIRAKGLGSTILVQILLIKGSIYEQTYDLLKHKIDVASTIKDTPSCVTCSRIFDCMSKGTRPYDVDCILDSSVKTTTIKIKEI